VIFNEEMVGGRERVTTCIHGRETRETSKGDKGSLPPICI